ncbi:Sugar transport protein [Thalictrum thalictroides]|uniref:Sugar transport protein n=1 Tax=Thalictrum thalictroides TaxID=46969 RepID=A0A7J6XAB9_THATH|nr:Sugar transport protein [Thalictrum thalictroides]
MSSQKAYSTTDVVMRSPAHNRSRDKAPITSSVVLISIVAASSGMLFGYDIGVSGGVTTMIPFIQTFFPWVLKNMAEAKQDYYCVFDSHVVTAFTSSLYIAGLVASLVAGRLTARMGRKVTLLIGGCFFFVGTAVNATAVNIPMLLLGRILLGFGVGFTNQAAPVYLNEMAPPKWRGAFNTGFQFFLSLGVVVATLTNFGVAHHGNSGWRIAIAIGAVPAILMIVGTLFIPDTPSSLVGRGKITEARQSLTKVRGISSDVETELNDIINSKEAAKAVKQDPYKTILRREYRPHLVISIAIPLCQQLTGINVTAFYAPVLFQSIGMGSDSALLSAVILGAVTLVSITLSGFLVDRCGRKVLFMEAGIQMIICQVAIASVLAFKVGASGEEAIEASLEHVGGRHRQMDIDLSKKY